MGIVQIVKDLFHQPIFVCFLAAITYLCFYMLKKEDSTRRRSIWLVYSSIFVVTSTIFFSSAVIRVINPQEWDFPSFYLWGKTAAAGLNYYQHENLHTVYNTLNLPFTDSVLYGFVIEIVNVGFLYPPPTILYFLPLGYLPFHTALLVWTIFNILFVIGSIYLTYKLFLSDYKLNGIFLASILCFILLPSLSTINFSQTNFILLFLLLLMKNYSEKGISGLILTLAIFTKPYMAIFGIFFLLRLKWKSIIYCIASSIILIGITIALFGIEPFISYIFHNPAHLLPVNFLSEDSNQSLNAVLLRNNFLSAEKPLNYLYIATLLFFTSMIYIVYLAKKKLYDYIWVILLLMGLLIYPGTLSHYGVLLLFIIFQLFSNKSQLSLNPVANFLIICIFFYLSTISVFSTLCFLILVIAIKSLMNNPLIDDKPKEILTHR